MRICAPASISPPMGSITSSRRPRPIAMGYLWHRPTAPNSCIPFLDFGFHHEDWVQGTLAFPNRTKGSENLLVNVDSYRSDYNGCNGASATENTHRLFPPLWLAHRSRARRSQVITYSAAWPRLIRAVIVPFYMRHSVARRYRRHPPYRYCLWHFLSRRRVLAVSLKLLPAGMRVPPPMRVATCVHEPSGLFLKASQGRSARPSGYEVIV
jgi:hypothetical protein